MNKVILPGQIKVRELLTETNIHLIEKIGANTSNITWTRMGNINILLRFTGQIDR